MELVVFEGGSQRKRLLQLLLDGLQALVLPAKRIPWMVVRLHLAARGILPGTQAHSDSTTEAPEAEPARNSVLHIKTTSPGLSGGVPRHSVAKFFVYLAKFYVCLKAHIKSSAGKDITRPRFRVGLEKASFKKKGALRAVHTSPGYHTLRIVVQLKTDRSTLQWTSWASRD